MITPENVLRHELIGLNVLVVHATNPAQEGITGLITDETRNMITIQTPVGLKHVPKKHSIFRVTLPDRVQVELSGSTIIGRPEKRITMRIKK
ncbi:MAG: ribonuclease P protein subunit [Methanocalculus sp. MSAO_Arc1]|uniref:ribonuclease P protein component 1 n=1 Tax=Methanocalculus TaxID=71151 RepID=UPI000FF178A1|nr:MULTISPECIES: ribonuclease P protein subunit [unclassified Methanocalculus]MCP1662986.1 ribonuclease P protein subunit POP4 [Methanocalculus sp. AMF5]RQD80755.1 MAG: ribonuclease P protein subunit [Methanocalculus sp. MSAO_Arc1]